MANPIYYKHVAFDNIDTVLRMFRRTNRTLSEVLDYFSQPANVQYVTEHYEQLPPYTVKEAIQLKNIEQRMVAIACFSAEDVAAELHAELVDEQTVEKKQFQWDENNRPVQKVYQDTYSLYRIDAAALNPPGAETDDADEDDFDSFDSFLEGEYIYYVKCVCPSTGRNYFVYVDEEIGEQRDAIAAIAWTMRINGQPIKKEMYLSLMYAES